MKKSTFFPSSPREEGILQQLIERIKINNEEASVSLILAKQELFKETETAHFLNNYRFEYQKQVDLKRKMGIDEEVYKNCFNFINEIKNNLEKNKKKIEDAQKKFQECQLNLQQNQIRLLSMKKIYEQKKRKRIILEIKESSSIYNSPLKNKNFFM